MWAPAGKTLVVLQVIKQACPGGQKGMYSKEEKGSEISNRRGIEFNDFFLFFAFSYVFSEWFGIALNNLASRKAVGGQELALNVHFLLCGWPPGSKTGSLLSEVRIKESLDSLLEVPISAPTPRWSPLSSECCWCSHSKSSCFCSLEKGSLGEMFWNASLLSLEWTVSNTLQILPMQEQDSSNLV